MRCPKCSYPRTKVIDSGRDKSTDLMIWRRRACLKCTYRWNTLELPEARLKATQPPSRATS